MLSNQYVHILIKPDAFWRNIVIEIIGALQDYGIGICLVDLIKPNKTLLDVMYDSEFCWEYDYYIHNKKIYQFGPSLSLVCRMDEEIDYRSIKGSSLPIYSKSNSIRDLFGVKDRCLNLIHIADNNQSTQEEIATIFGKWRCEEKTKETLTIDRIESMVDRLLVNRNLCYKDVVNSLKLRICHRINCIITLVGEKNIVNLEDVPNVEKYLSRDLNKLSELCVEIKNVINGANKDVKIRYLEYLLALLDKEMIYISEIEKYVLWGQCYYNEINIE